MVNLGFSLHTIYFTCCVLLISCGYNIDASLSSQDVSEMGQTTDEDSETNKPPSLSSTPHADKSENLRFPLTRNRRSNNNLENNAALGSVFQYNDQIMRNLLKPQAPKPLSYARSHFFLNLLKPLNRRTVRYSGWDDHSVMHFGKRSPVYDEYEDLFIKRNPYPFSDHSVMHFGKRFQSERDAQNFDEKRSPYSWSEHQVMHFGKRSLESDKDTDIEEEADQLLIEPSAMQSHKQEESKDITDTLKDDNNFLIDKRNEPWHRVMNFGKKSDNSLSDPSNIYFDKQRQDSMMDTDSMVNIDKKAENLWDHSTMHFGKKNDPWHSIMSFGKKSENPWDHSTLHFGKRDEYEPWHSMMNFGKRSENLWDHSTMHFGKRNEKNPWHSMMNFGKKSDNFWDHNTMHFGKRYGTDTWHSMMNFGKKSENPWDHSTMHFGKRDVDDPWHNMMSFGKRSDILWDHNTMHFGKRDASDPQHTIMSLGKKSGNPWDQHSTLHFGKREDADNWDNMMNFGKKSESPWNNHNTMHFGKRDTDDPWHSMMSFGKKSESPWNSHDTMHFGKRDVDDPWHSMMSFGKKSGSPWNNHNTMHFGKRNAEDPWPSMMSFEKKSNDMTDILDTLTYEKRAAPWESHNTMHFGKRSNESVTQYSSQDDSLMHYPYKHREKRSVKEINNQNTEHSDKRADPWENHNTMHFGKKSESWDHHNTLHFGKKSNYSEDSSPKVLEELWKEPWNNQQAELEKKHYPWENHNTMHFGKRFDDSWANHNTLHFGKKLDPWESHNTMHFGKKSEPWENHNTMHFGKKSDPWESHDTMHFEKKLTPWESHNTMHFGKKSDPWESHNTMHFGKKSSPWESHNTMHFGKKSDPWENHNTLHFGKKSEPWENHNTMHFGKKSDPWESHDTMHFEKKLTPWESHNTMHFGKKSEPWENHNTMHFGKKSELWENHNTMHFGKKSDPWENHNTLHFGKKSEPWENHNTMHFGKKSDPWENHNTMHFGKKFDPWENHNTMHFGKRFDSTEQNILVPEIHEDELQNNFTKETATKSDDIKLPNQTPLLENGFDGKVLVIKKRSIRKPTNNINTENKKRENITLKNIKEFTSRPSLVSKALHTKTVILSQTPINSNQNGNKLSEDYHNEEKLISKGLELNDTKERMWHDEMKDKKINVINKGNEVHVNKRSVESNTLQNNNYDSAIEKQNQDFEIFEEYPGDEPPDAVLHFGKRSADYGKEENDKKSENPWDINSDMNFAKRSEDPWESHNTMHFGKKSDPWENHSTLHFGKKFDPWENHGTLHFGKKSDPWESHGTLHFGKKSDAWESHSTLHFGKKSSPFGEHDTLHFGKKSNPWEDHSTMHFGKRSENAKLPQSEVLLSTGEQKKLNENKENYVSNDLELPNQARMVNKLKELIFLHDTPTQLTSDSQILSFLKNSLEKTKLDEFGKGFQLQPNSNDVIQSLLKEENLDSLSKKRELLKEYFKQLDLDEPQVNKIMNEYNKSKESGPPILSKDDQGVSEDSSLNFLYKWLLDKAVSVYREDAEEENKFGEISKAYEEPNSYIILPSAPRRELLNGNGVSKGSFKMKRKFTREPEYKRYWAPFQGPKSIVYPHAWFASQIRRSVLPTNIIVPRSYETRMTEKKEDPVNSFMHFGRR
ncbi:FMRF-amide neuropeptide, partial [Stegodyphus mimosarum]